MLHLLYYSSQNVEQEIILFAGWPDINSNCLKKLSKGKKYCVIKKKVKQEQAYSKFQMNVNSEEISVVVIRIA